MCTTQTGRGYVHISAQMRSSDKGDVHVCPYCAAAAVSVCVCVYEKETK